jgi:multiple sugar transport system substrate-binding protein
MVSTVARCWHSVWLTMLLAGCVASPAGQPTPAQPASASEAVTVRFMVAGGPPEQAAFQSVVDGFQASQPVQVELIAVPSTDDFMTRLTADVATGAPPDVFVLNYRRMTQFYNKGALEPLGPYLQASQQLKEADYYPVALDAFRDSQQTLVCLPQNVSSQVVYYNKDLFDKAGVPYPPEQWAWEELRQTAIKLTVPDQNGDTWPDKYGLGLEPVLIRMAPFIWQNGGELVDNPAQPTQLTISTPAARAALDFVLSLGREDGVVPNYSAEAVASHQDRFLAGNIAMYVDSRVLVPTLRESVKFNWDVAALPQGKIAANVLHSDGYCLAAASKNKAAAWAFIEYALGPQGEERASRLGRTVPSLQSVAESNAFLDPSQPPANAQVWLDNMAILHVLPKLENWPAIERTAATELELAYIGAQDMETVITNIEASAADGFVPIK